LAEPLIAQRRFYLTYIVYWVIWIIIQTSLLQWYGLPAKQSLADSAVTFVLLAVVCVIVCNILTYYQPSRDLMVYLCVLGSIATVVWGFADKALLQVLVYTSDTHTELLNKSIPVRFCIGFLNIGWIILITLFWKKMEEQRDAQNKEDDLDKISRDAELYKLRQQLHPHFLFNSLNSINALIHSQPEQARMMVQQLSEFLRGTLKREENQMITLAEELEYLQLYLDIEKVRFGHRLRATFDTVAETSARKVPPLVLQPLMENAIKFGLYGTTGDVIIGLHARMIDHYLVVAITNPYEADMQMPEGTGFGLKSIRRRLYLLFGRDDLMEVNQEGDFFTVIFRIPQHED
jgi:hypothetical protein